MTFGGGGFGTLNLLKVKVRPLIDFYHVVLQNDHPIALQGYSSVNRRRVCCDSWDCSKVTCSSPS